MKTREAVRDQFAYHPATPETAPRHAAVRDLFRSTLDQLREAVPDGPEKTLAIGALQESQMYANLAVALTAPANTGETRATARVLSSERKEGATRVRACAVGVVPGEGKGVPTGWGTGDR